jgi:hypothetical protein
MADYFYDLGDPAYVTFQLTDPATGLPPTALQETTIVATSAVTDPDAVASTPTPAHVGAAGSGTYALTFTLGKAGVWRGEAIFTGALTQRIPFALVVSAAAALLAWSPTLTEVADYVPGRTRPATPGAGDDTLLGTFTPLTRPTGEQTARLIAGATAHVAATVGTVDLSLYALAKAAAAQRAAAYVELAYPERDADLNTADRLLTLSDTALAQLEGANLAVSGATVGIAAMPVWAMPTPVAWGDVDI